MRQRLVVKKNRSIYPGREASAFHKPEVIREQIQKYTGPEDEGDDDCGQERSRLKI